MGQKSSRSGSGRGNPRLPELPPQIEEELKKVVKASRRGGKRGLNLEVMRRQAKMLLANPGILRQIVRAVDAQGLRLP